MLKTKSFCTKCDLREWLGGELLWTTDLGQCFSFLLICGLLLLLVAPNKNILWIENKIFIWVFSSFCFSLLYDFFQFVFFSRECKIANKLSTLYFNNNQFFAYQNSFRFQIYWMDFVCVCVQVWFVLAATISNARRIAMLRVYSFCFIVCRGFVRPAEIRTIRLRWRPVVPNVLPHFICSKLVSSWRVFLFRFARRE